MPKFAEEVDDEFISIREAAQMLGVSPWTLYKGSSRRDFPLFKFGARVLIPKKTFLKWLSEKYRIEPRRA